MSEYTQMEENMRSPKNRFFGIFCHANQVDDHWGFNWSFTCGVVVLSIVMGIWTIYDISSMSTMMSRGLLYGLYVLFFILRFISDFIAVAGIVFAVLSILGTNFKRATIAYYLMLLSFILDFSFVIYCITRFFDSIFWRATTFHIFLWILNIVAIFLFCWILFCNMVNIGRKIRNLGAANPF